jgi:hypothetical protein
MSGTGVVRDAGRIAPTVGAVATTSAREARHPRPTQGCDTASLSYTLAAGISTTITRPTVSTTRCRFGPFTRLLASQPGDVALTVAAPGTNRVSG